MQNPDFAKFVFDANPEFISKDNDIMIALSISASSPTIQYYEEIYTKLREEGTAPYSFWFERTSGCEDCSGDIVEEHEYAFVCSIGRVNRREEMEIQYCTRVIVREILARVGRFF